MTRPSRCLVVGTGYRAKTFLRLTGKLSELELVGLVVSGPGRVQEAEELWHVPTYLSLPAALSGQHPDFVVVAVPWNSTPGLIIQAVVEGYRVLAETPPAPDVEGLRSLWAEVGAAGMVQVAEQYPLYPEHMARLTLVRQGALGRVTSVQVSSTHGYHAVALVRAFLGVGFNPAIVSARAFSAPLVNPLGKEGWTDDEAEHLARTVIATLDFGGSMGLYDFTDNQWHNHLLSRRLTVRGARGEVADSSVVRLTAPRTIVRSDIVRRQVGYDMDLDGYDTDHLSFDGQVLFRNPFFGKRLADDEIATASLLVSMAAWSRGDGLPPYPLAEACQDHLISIAIDKSAETGLPITTSLEAWAT